MGIRTMALAPVDCPDLGYAPTLNLLEKGQTARQSAFAGHGDAWNVFSEAPGLDA
jgi:hypothetical protein